jgi:septation ring formation regulator EzrA
MSKEMRQHIDKFNKFKLTESENLNISDVSDSDFDEISDKVLEYFEKLGKNKEELDWELKKIISSELKKIFDFFYY